MEHRSLAGIVLAAGASSRMGSPKALLDVHGRPAVEVVVDLLRGAGADPVVVVVGRHAREIGQEANLRGLVVVDHRDWELGRTSSIQAGLRALPPDTEGTLLANVDMPLVLAETVRSLADAFHGADPDVELVLPVYVRRFGHPVVIARSLFDGLLGLGGDESPRELFRGRRRLEVPTDDTGIVVDLDTPESLQELT